MDLPPSPSQPTATGEHNAAYRGHGFATTTSPLGTADATFFSEQSHQQYDFDNAHGNDDDDDDDDDDNAVPRDEEALPEIETAYSEARARGLPDGWTCSIDVC